MAEHAPIYLDYNATTPVDPRVLEAMLPYFSEIYGNPGNGYHRQGRLAEKAIQVAREQVAALLGAEPHEILFTSGATESNNLAIGGLAGMRQVGPRRRIVTTAVEHKAVLLPIDRLRQQGWDVVILPVDPFGRVDLAAAKAAIDETTLLVSIHAANNEIGTLQPIQEIAAIAHEQGALLHTDAAQAVGKLPLDVAEWGVDLLSASAHKLYGPKGIGALFVRGGVRRIPLEPLAVGGGQESGLRPGTPNVPAIVGFGAACRIAAEEVGAEAGRLRALRDRFEHHLGQGIPGLRMNGHPTERLPNTSSLIFPGVEADALLLNLPSVMMGTGSACTSGAIEPSHVLQAIGLGRDEAYQTVRASLGRFTSEEDVDSAAAGIVEGWRSMAVGDAVQ
jgi:cysteine desulfurase